MSKDKPTPQERWQAERRKNITIAMIAPTDDDVLEMINKQPNKAGYIKALVRADIAKNKEKEKTV